MFAAVSAAVGSDHEGVNRPSACIDRISFWAVAAAAGKLPIVNPAAACAAPGSVSPCVPAARNALSISYNRSSASCRVSTPNIRTPSWIRASASFSFGTIKYSIPAAAPESIAPNTPRTGRTFPDSSNSPMTMTGVSSGQSACNTASAIGRSKPLPSFR